MTNEEFRAAARQWFADRLLQRARLRVRDLSAMTITINGEVIDAPFAEPDGREVAMVGRNYGVGGTLIAQRTIHCEHGEHALKHLGGGAFGTSCQVCNPNGDRVALLRNAAGADAIMAKQATPANRPTYIAGQRGASRGGKGESE